MEPEAIKSFSNKFVKLELRSGFGLKGTIIETYEKCFLFRTKQADSLLEYEDIQMLVEHKNDNREG